MAFKKKFAKKWTKKTKGAGAGIVALKMVKQLKRATAPEYKFLMLSFNGINVGNTGELKPVNNVTQGAGILERIGKSIKCARISGNIWIRMNPLVSSTLVRFIIFQGKAENGDTSGTGGTAYEIQSSAPNSLLNTGLPGVVARKNQQMMYSTKTLFDKCYNLSNNGTNNKLAKINVRLNNFTNFKDDSIDIMDGGIYFLAISDVAANYPSITGELKTSYTDC